MGRPLRKPFWRWEPLPYLVLVLLLLFTGSVRADAAPAVFWPALAVTVAAAIAFVVLLIGQARRGRPNPDSSGDLYTLDGLAVVDVPASADRPVPVVEVNRHQAAIDASQAWAGADRAQTAVLVPGASRWLGLRLRVSVQLVSEHAGVPRIHHAGFLPEQAAEKWQQELAALRRAGVYLRVPAIVVGSGRPFTVQLDLGGLGQSVRTASAQVRHS